MIGADVVEIEGGASVLICNTIATMTISPALPRPPLSRWKKAAVKGSPGIQRLHGRHGDAEDAAVSVTVGTTTLTVKNFGVTYAMNAGCAISKVETSFPELTLLPEEPTAIQFFHYGQTGTGKVNGTSASITDGGVLQLPEAVWGKYGIG